MAEAALEQVKAAASKVYGADGVEVPYFLVRADASPAEAAARAAQIAYVASHEFNACLDCNQTLSYCGDDPPNATGYKCGAVQVFGAIGDADVKLNVAAHFSTHANETVPRLAVAPDPEGGYRVSVAYCVSQGDLDSMVAMIRAWGSPQ